ncbi:MAG: cardiolipin synthase, partial [Clostridiales bacterium]|nr:cardiolipin synthase [Clostridiales bacterium]
AVDCMKDIIEEVKKAEKFIFLEYHAIENSTYFLKLADVLEEKARNGVEVRLIYDEVGSMVFINKDFIKDMEKRGISCRVFNPIVPTINVLMNNRDHRKITVIDGKVSFTGGFNLADEYFNLVSPYGYWKDTGVKITGKATINLTTIFLEMWNQIKQTDSIEKIQGFLSASDEAIDTKDGQLVQPYADTPLDFENVGRNVYLNIISAAKKYIYISTPYLIIDDETFSALSLAAGRGVDVRILIPEIPDKKFVYRATCSYATLLAKNNVKIYKFTPGFNHAKQIVCDDEIASCGTINFDYRSLYFHFENAALFTSPDAIASMKEDFENTFKISFEATETFSQRLKRTNILYDNIVRLISPLF